MLFQKQALLLSLGKEALKLVVPLKWAILSHWAPYKQLLVKTGTSEQENGYWKIKN